MSFVPITCLGQNSLQMPHDLHHALIMTGSYCFLRFFDFSLRGLPDLPFTFASLMSATDIFRISFTLFFICGYQNIRLDLYGIALVGNKKTETDGK